MEAGMGPLVSPEDFSAFLEDEAGGVAGIEPVAHPAMMAEQVEDFVTPDDFEPSLYMDVEGIGIGQSDSLVTPDAGLPADMDVADTTAEETESLVVPDIEPSSEAGVEDTAASEMDSVVEPDFEPPTDTDT